MMSGALPLGRASDTERIAEPIGQYSLLPATVAGDHAFEQP